METNSLSPETIDEMVRNRRVRTAITSQSFLRFFQFYFHDHITYPIAPFHEKWFGLAEDYDQQNFFIIAARGFGKSTIFTQAYPLWSILGRRQKKFVLIACQTLNQAKSHLRNVKDQMEKSTLLSNDLGPFKEESDEWGGFSIVLPQQKARITAVSIDQSIRGIKHGRYRPDLLIADDLEDKNSVRNFESREKTYHWVKSELLPVGDKHTQLVMIGNLLHKDSLLSHIEADIKDGNMTGKFRRYPLLDENGTCLWPGKYPSPADVEAERKRIGSEIDWQLEYLLKVIPPDYQVVHPDWPKYYAKPAEKPWAAYIGVDLAISKKDTADFTAIIIVVIEEHNEKFQARVLPHVVNKRMSYLETMEIIKNLYTTYRQMYPYLKIFIEDVAYQKAAIEELKRQGCLVEGIPVNIDKRSRLEIASSLIQSGKVKFSERGNEQLVQQLVNFGIEKHDDLADAFTLIAPKIIEAARPFTHLWEFFKDSDKGSNKDRGITSGLFDMKF